MSLCSAFKESKRGKISRCARNDNESITVISSEVRDLSPPFFKGGGYEEHGLENIIHEFCDVNDLFMFTCRARSESRRSRTGYGPGTETANKNSPKSRL